MVGPFYAMRFIKGDSLKTAIQDYRANRKHSSVSERNLELRRLLRRFIDVCEAVHYAHSRCILHRRSKTGQYHARTIRGDTRIGLGLGQGRW